MIYNNLEDMNSLRTMVPPCLGTRRKGSPCVFSKDANFSQVFLSMAVESMGDRAHSHGQQAVYIHMHPSNSVSLENPNFYSLRNSVGPCLSASLFLSILTASPPLPGPG